MRCVVPVFACAACVEHGELPTSCDPDLELIGSPGAIDRLEHLLVAGEVREHCLVLDASKNRDVVTFVASEGFFTSSTTLEFRSVDGTVLGHDDDTGKLLWEMPPGPRMHFTLTVAATPGVLQVGVGIGLEFYERQ